jgi:hypothetical protein
MQTQAERERGVRTRVWGDPGGSLGRLRTARSPPATPTNLVGGDEQKRVAAHVEASCRHTLEETPARGVQPKRVSIPHAASGRPNLAALAGPGCGAALVPGAFFSPKPTEGGDESLAVPAPSLHLPARARATRHGNWGIAGQKQRVRGTEEAGCAPAGGLARHRAGWW